jgi:glycosyltransferase involved in cell wall biosynthesis
MPVKVRAMRVSLVTDTFLPEVNGVTTVLDTMHRGLLRRGHAVQVIAPRYGGEPEQPGVLRRPAVPLPGYAQSRLVLPLSAEVRAALDDFAPDVVHVVTEGVLGAMGRRHALRRRWPLVTSFHTDFPRYAARYLGEWAVQPVRRYVRWFHGAAASTQTPSAATRAELEAMGVPRAVVWGRGVASSFFTPGRRSGARREALGAAGRTLVLHVSRLAVEKDVDTLVEAFRRARAALGDEACFVVAGDGPRAPGVRRALPFAVHRGFLGRGELADLYADADLFVFPSPTETCGLVVLEAMASGLPVIASDRGGVLENLRHGINGLVVPAGDPGAFAAGTVELARGSAQRDALAQAARAFAVARDWERELDALEPMYAAAIAARRRGRDAVAGPLAVQAADGGA